MYIEQTRRWIYSFVIKHNLCPFAKGEMDKNTVRFELSQATNSIDAMDALQAEIDVLNSNKEIETSFLIFPLFLHDFFDYLNFSDMAVNQLVLKGYEGIYQLASFHPDYCFADANFDDVSNYTNRSPYPMLQILRDASLEKSIKLFGNIGSIPKKNMAYLRALGINKVKKILKECQPARVIPMKDNI